MPACPPLPREDLDHVLSHTRELWEEARGQSFFITGGTGFFGMWLLESFCHVNDALSLDMRATVLTRNPEAFAQKAPHLAARSDLQFIRGDIRSFEFPPGEFPYIVHAATEASAKLNEEAPQEMLDAIIGGTRRVLDFAAGARVRKLLLTSSGAVYGKQPSEITHVSEEYLGAPDPLQPGSAYGEGKRVSEHMVAVHARQHHYEVKIARCFAFVGPHLPLDAHFAIGNFLRDAMTGGPIRVGGDGTPYRSYLYAADLAVWLWTILLCGVPLRPYNVGSGEDYSIAQIANSVATAFTPTPNIVRAQRNSAYDPAKHRPPVGYPVSRYVPDAARARQELALEGWVPLGEAIMRTRNWCLRP